MEPLPTSAVTTSWNWRDRTALAGLALVGWATRLPSLDRVALNPDESQYESTAAYLLSSDLSAFAIPHTMPGTFAFYEGMARVFGPYPMLEVRVAMMLIVIGLSWMIYSLVREEAGLWSGVAAGLVVPLWSVFFEGLSANREWFCNVLLIAGMGLFLRGFGRRERRGDVALLLSGVFCGAALWFKLQAVVMVLPVAVFCVWRVVGNDGRAAALRALGLYVCGGVAIGLAGMLPFVAEGTLGSYLGSVWIDLWGYAGAGRVAADGSDWSLVDRFYTGIPGRPLLLAVYGFGLLTLGSMAYRTISRRDTGWPIVARPAAQLFVLALLAAMGCVSMGARFFGHYYLFLVPPVAVLLGLAVGLLVAGTPSRLRVFAAGSLAALLAIDRAIGWTGALSLAAWVSIVAALLLAVFALSRPRTRLPLTLGVWIGVEVVFVGLATIGLLHPPSAPDPDHRYREISAALYQRSHPGDRLFVWGWAPEIYSLTQLTPASQFTVSTYLVDDTGPSTEASFIDPGYERLLMDELRVATPRFVVDASRRSWTMARAGDASAYDLERYPAFELNRYLERHYHAVGAFGGCVLYERLAP